MTFSVFVVNMNFNIYQVNKVNLFTYYCIQIKPLYLGPYLLTGVISVFILNEYERHDLGHGVFFHQIFELIN